MKIERSVVVSLFVMSLFIMIPTADIRAQEYKYEIGGAAGTSFYMGDANKTQFYLHPGLSGGFLFRYNPNFLWSIKTGIFIANVSGKSDDSGNAFPYAQQASFQRTLAELGTQVEFNFFPYSDKYAYLGTRPYTPYLFTGAGVTYAEGNKKFIGANIPVGMGFKYKLKNRMNIGIEFSMRKLFGDDFDVTEKTTGWNLDNPFSIEGSFLKNKDWYSFTMIFLTWEFSMREDPCHGN
ncbi:MAG: DUF6089 family protein [Proteiniphilum sp.]|uniref:type IX secretion system protein PorG n=1 Tax=Proteiniphilum sp. TaxID=1926877 RepID=UPI002ABA84F8|nr:DUF6089 family protein [Proteiniphilum sp.]MDY9917746.1 DUF6089 family protein [Proteiniphilum sp.]